MTSPLAALSRAYELRLAWTMEGRLGLPTAVRHQFDRALLPPPELEEIHTRVKEPHIFCVELADSDGRLELIPLKSPCSRTQAETLTHALVRQGLHPLDAKIVTVDVMAHPEPTFASRSAVDHLLWTHAEQRQLERELEAQR